MLSPSKQFGLSIRCIWVLGAAIALGHLSAGCGAKNSSTLFGAAPTDGSLGDDAGVGGRPTGGADGGAINLGSSDSGPLDGGVLGSNCATATAGASRRAAYMLIILDGSLSMSQDQKWAAAIPALDAFFDDVKARADHSFGVGLTVFSDSNDPLGGGYTSPQVPIAFVDDAQAQALHARIDSSLPQRDTPTVAVLQGQYPLVEGFVPGPQLAPNGRKIVVLMTDGVPTPDFSSSMSPQDQCTQMASAEFAKPPPAGSITTFAVGIGIFQPLMPMDYDPLFMGAMAVAGGAPNPSCNPMEVNDASKMCHFQITPGTKSAAQLEQDFLAAINKIRGEISSCEFTVEKPQGGGQIDPSKVNVVYTDSAGQQSVVPHDPQNGWTYNDPSNPTTVELHGAACDKLKANVTASIHVVLGCKTQGPR